MMLMTTGLSNPLLTITISIRECSNFWNWTSLCVFCFPLLVVTASIVHVILRSLVIFHQRSNVLLDFIPF